MIGTFIFLNILNMTNIIITYYYNIYKCYYYNIFTIDQLEIEILFLTIT